MFNHTERAVRALEGLQPLAQRGARVYVAKVFLPSGLTTVHDWDTMRRARGHCACRSGARAAFARRSRRGVLESRSGGDALSCGR